MRKLVTIRKISEVLPIENADLIELAKIDGWRVVVKKHQFKAGDLCVYGEIDCIFPAADRRFEFLEGKRLRTKKLRGVVSQGIAFPLSILGEIAVAEGDEVTQMLGVVKYEPPPPTAVEAKGEFPWFVPKTDEERVQNLLLELTEQTGKPAYVTEKLDGSSITVFSRIGEDGWQTGVCSRNLELRRDVENPYTATVRKLGIVGKLQDYCMMNNRQLALQGELIGAGVNGNKYQLDGTNIKFFNVYDITEQANAALDESLETLEDLGLESVPILESDFILHDNVELYLKEAEGKSRLNDKADREGIVIRTNDGGFSFKAISNRFLLKND